MDESTEIQREISELRDELRSALDLFTALNRPKLVNQLKEALHDPQRRVAYQLTEEGRSSRAISEAMGEVGLETPPSTIRLWQQEWIRDGIVRKVSARKRERVFDLEALGIDIDKDLSDIAEQD